MSSNFLDKSGLSYFFGKIKEMLQGKQDKLTAGDGIMIDENNVISASGGSSSGEEVYRYSIAEQTVTTNGYKVTIKANGAKFESSELNAWRLQILRQNILVPTLDGSTVALACDILIDGVRHYGSVICYIKNFYSSSGKLSCVIRIANILTIDSWLTGLVLYTQSGSIDVELTAYEHRIL